MKKSSLAVVSGVTLLALTFSSCETPTGQGAAIGAGTGAVVGALAGAGPRGYGNRHRAVQGAAAGAAIGAIGGALIGAAVEADQAQQYGPEPQGGYPYGRRSGTPGFVYSPYPPNRVVDVRDIPRGALVRDPSTGGVFRNP